MDTDPNQGSAIYATAAHHIQQRRVTWFLKWVAVLIIAPLCLLIAMELALRAFGFWHSSAYLLSQKDGAGREFLNTNKTFLWNFFPGIAVL